MHNGGHWFDGESDTETCTRGGGCQVTKDQVRAEREARQGKSARRLSTLEQAAQDNEREIQRSYRRARYERTGR